MTRVQYLALSNDEISVLIVDAMTRLQGMDADGEEWRATYDRATELSNLLADTPYETMVREYEAT